MTRGEKSMDDKIYELKQMRDELLKRADALDYAIRILEGQQPVNEFSAAKKKKKHMAGNTSFTVESKTTPAVIPERNGGIMIWDDTDDILHD
jgi:hypothetical protein